MPSILVTGTAGYIGSVVTEILLLKGFEVIGIDNFQEGKREAVNKNIIFYEGDFGNERFISNIFNSHKIDCVFHFAAETTIDFSMNDPAKYFHNNVVNGIKLLEVMRKFDRSKIIFSSTAAIFGEPIYTPIDENHIQKPINSYGESKLMFEKILDWYNYAYGFKFNLFRYFNAAGATKMNGEDREHESHLLPLVFQTMNGRRKKLKVFGNNYDTPDGTCIRDYLHVSDVAEAHILGLKNLENNSTGKYNLGSGNGYSVLEVIKTVESTIGKKVDWEYAPRRKGDPARLVASNSLAIKELRWNPYKSNLETIVKDSYSWSIEHPNGYNTGV
jgi:UDP-glucose 4-epimerase